ncbi:unnamed protein product [Dicrocoelium dendriticum]|nr:unnamed protein product [Dicrocoelium dendriticum]
MVRWLRLRLRMLPLVAGLLEPCSEAVTVGVLFALSVNYLFDVPFFYLVLGHFIIWLALDYTLLRLVQHGPLPLSVPKFLLVWLFREMLVYVIFLKAITNPSAITWGKYSYHVKMGGLTTRMAPSSALRDLPEANACPTRVDFNKPGNAYAHVASNDRFTCVVNEDPSAIPLNSFASDLPKNHLDV